MLFSTGKVIGSGAFGQVFKSDAVGIVAFDPRSSIKGKGARRRSRFGSARSPYYNNKQVTVVACKGLKGKNSYDFDDDDDNGGGGHSGDGVGCDNDDDDDNDHGG